MMPNKESNEKKIKAYILLFFKGMGMGGADVVPGVSGGTIAFITGIYEELLDSIKSVNLDSLKLLAQLKIKAFWSEINGAFLLPILLGIMVSIFTLAGLISYLLENQEIPTWSFFFGLIAISAITVLKQIHDWNWKVALSLFLGIVLAYFITELNPASTPDTWWFVFISGAIAICAMILPGISGSFLLLILGKYEYVLNAVKDLHVPTIAVFVLGCLTGLLSFVRLISWLLHRHHNVAIALLSGFMIGSLNKVWPWKIPTQFRINSQGDQEPFLYTNALPTQFEEILGKNAHTLEAILLAAVGVFLVIFLEKIAFSLKKDKTQ